MQYLYDDWWFFHDLFPAFLSLARAVASIVVLTPLVADMPWIVSVRAFAFPASIKFPFPLLWGDECGGDLVVPLPGFVNVHVNDFLCASAQHILALDGEYPPVGVHPFFP